MAKKTVVETNEVICYEIIKIGPGIEGFDDVKRQNALKGSFGNHIQFLEGPSIKSDDFARQLQSQIRSLSDLAALEVSTALSETEIRHVLEKCLGTLVIQPQFSNSVFIRYITFGLGELTIRPIDLYAGHQKS